MKPLFCTRCHKRIIPPKFLMGGNVNVKNSITLNCGDSKCKGFVKFKPKQEDNKEDSVS